MREPPPKRGRASLACALALALVLGAAPGPAHSGGCIIPVLTIDKVTLAHVLSKVAAAAEILYMVQNADQLMYETLMTIGEELIGQMVGWAPEGSEWMEGFVQRGALAILYGESPLAALLAGCDFATSAHGPYGSDMAKIYEAGMGEQPEWAQALADEMRPRDVLGGGICSTGLDLTKLLKDDWANTLALIAAGGAAYGACITYARSESGAQSVSEHEWGEERPCTVEDREHGLCAGRPPEEQYCRDKAAMAQEKLGWARGQYGQLAETIPGFMRFLEGGTGSGACNAALGAMKLQIPGVDLNSPFEGMGAGHIGWMIPDNQVRPGCVSGIRLIDALNGKIQQVASTATLVLNNAIVQGLADGTLGETLQNKLDGAAERVRWLAEHGVDEALQHGKAMVSQFGERLKGLPNQITGAAGETLRRVGANAGQASSEIRDATTEAMNQSFDNALETTDPASDIGRLLAGAQDMAGCAFDVRRTLATGGAAPILMVEQSLSTNGILPDVTLQDLAAQVPLGIGAQASARCRSSDTCPQAMATMMESGAGSGGMAGRIGERYDRMTSATEAWVDWTTEGVDMAAAARTATADILVGTYKAAMGERMTPESIDPWDLGDAPEWIPEPTGTRKRGTATDMLYLSRPSTTDGWHRIANRVAPRVHETRDLLHWADSVAGLAHARMQLQHREEIEERIHTVQARAGNCDGLLCETRVAADALRMLTSQKVRGAHLSLTRLMLEQSHWIREQEVWRATR